MSDDNFDENFKIDGTQPKPGRPTVHDDQLSANRDKLVGMLSAWWAEIGWQLTTAKTREDLRQAFQPVLDHPDKNLINRLLRPTEINVKGSEIRRKRRTLRKAVEYRFTHRMRGDRCIAACSEIEVAMGQATPEQMESVQAEFFRRRTDCQTAQAELHSANLAESAVEHELADAEGSFAQERLLEFILKRKYALHPFNIANAMAGLPYATDLEFLGVWMSRERCAKIPCRFWPHFHYQVFATIRSIWNDLSGSAISPVDHFRRRIEGLPKTVKPAFPQEQNSGNKKVTNSIRNHMADNFYYLRRAVEKSSQVTNIDPRRMPFVISSNFSNLLAQPRSTVDVVLANAARIH